MINPKHCDYILISIIFDRVEGILDKHLVFIFQYTRFSVLQ